MSIHGSTPLVAVTSMAFDDVVALLGPLGFRFERVRGTHRIYRHPEVPQPFALQPESGNAKPSEVNELLEILDRYDLPGLSVHGRSMLQPKAA